MKRGLSWDMLCNTHFSVHMRDDNTRYNPEYTLSHFGNERTASLSQRSGTHCSLSFLPPVFFLRLSLGTCAPWYDKSPCFSFSQDRLSSLPWLCGLSKCTWKLQRLGDSKGFPYCAHRCGCYALFNQETDLSM